MSVTSNSFFKPLILRKAFTILTGIDMKFGMYSIKKWLRVLGNLAWVFVIFRGRLVLNLPQSLPMP